jgi:putative membrane protein
MPMMYWHGDWNEWAWVVMVVSMVAFWALVVVGIWLAVRSSTTPRADRSRSAEETLRQRYAAGELDEEEFARRLNVLREDSMTRS